MHIVVHEEQFLTLHTSQKNICIVWVGNEEALGKGHLAFLLHSKGFTSFSFASHCERIRMQEYLTRALKKLDRR